MLRIRSFVACRVVMRVLLTVAVIGSICASHPAEARDRPGTPNQEVLNFCGFEAAGYKPMLCGHYTNSASEEPFAFDRNALDCNHIGGVEVSNDVETPVGHSVQPYNEPYHMKRPANDPPGYPYMFEGVASAGPGTRSSQGSIGFNLCAYNATGQACNHKVISVLDQSPENQQMPAAHRVAQSIAKRPAASTAGAPRRRE